MPRKKNTVAAAADPTPAERPTQEYYCVKEKRKVTAPVDTVVETKNRRLMAKGTCPSCGTKLNRFLSKQAGTGLLSMLGIKIPGLSDIPLLGDVLF